MSHLRELKLEVECDECARKDRVIRQYAENHSKLVEEVSAAQEVARAAGKEVTKLKGKLRCSICGSTDRQKILLIPQTDRQMRQGRQR